MRYFLITGQAQLGHLSGVSWFHWEVLKATKESVAISEALCDWEEAKEDAATLWRQSDVGLPLELVFLIVRGPAAGLMATHWAHLEPSGLPAHLRELQTMPKGVVAGDLGRSKPASKYVTVEEQDADFRARGLI